jgi:hypothetical protein
MVRPRVHGEKLKLNDPTTLGCQWGKALEGHLFSLTLCKHEVT